MIVTEDWLDWWNDWQFADSEGLFMGVSWNSIQTLGKKAQVSVPFAVVSSDSSSRWANSRLQDRESVERELLHSGCTHVMNAAGLTGRPNVDWCETHRQELLNMCWDTRSWRKGVAWLRIACPLIKKFLQATSPSPFPSPLRCITNLSRRPFG